MLFYSMIGSSSGTWTWPMMSAQQAQQGQEAQQGQQGHLDVVKGAGDVSTDEVGPLPPPLPAGRRVPLAQGRGEAAEDVVGAKHGAAE